jgi:hypothetical protein
VNYHARCLSRNRWAMSFPSWTSLALHCITLLCLLSCYYAAACSPGVHPHTFMLAEGQGQSSGVKQGISTTHPVQRMDPCRALGNPDLPLACPLAIMPQVPAQNFQCMTHSVRLTALLHPHAPCNQRSELDIYRMLFCLSCCSKIEGSPSTPVYNRRSLQAAEVGMAVAPKEDQQRSAAGEASSK